MVMVIRGRKKGGGEYTREDNDKTRRCLLPVKLLKPN